MDARQGATTIASGKPTSFSPATSLERLLRRDRHLVLAALIGLALLAWAYLIWLAFAMRMGGMNMRGWRMVPAGAGWMVPAGAAWSGIEWLLVYLMWFVMMIGMMAPSAAPVLLIHARLVRQTTHAGSPAAQPMGRLIWQPRNRAASQSLAATGWFAAGYLLVWALFSVLATALQWALDRSAQLNALMSSDNRWLAGSVLIAAGLYQWSPLKRRCLTACQSPLQFILRAGGLAGPPSAALWRGVRHGSDCVGCCGVLMLLLFVGGVMNLLWIAGLSALVLAEKLLPAGQWLARAGGLCLLVAGGAVWFAGPQG